MTIHDEESRSLAELYAAAQAEGGTLTVYAGGDFAAQQDGTAKAFRAAFPKIDFQVVVDYSKYHNVRIDRQLRDGALVPDVTHLQTTFDFDRWKAQGVLMPYRPAGFAQVYEGFKDPDAHFVAIGTFAFSFMHATGGGRPHPKTWSIRSGAGASHRPTRKTMTQPSSCSKNTSTCTAGPGWTHWPHKTCALAVAPTRPAMRSAWAAPKWAWAATTPAQRA